ncbi:hypothetical protein ANRL3_00519 [Anaerolineae bacterium]|nr:hypothetical protein ANRL3_00519 [Anaerolineae bacterium]
MNGEESFLCTVIMGIDMPFNLIEQRYNFLDVLFSTPSFIAHVNTHYTAWLECLEEQIVFNFEIQPDSKDRHPNDTNDRENWETI